MFRIYDKINRGEIYVIAEMSANHGGELGNALEIAREAAKAGADCVKIQTYTADTMTIDCDSEIFRIHGGPWDGYKLYDLYRDAGTPWEWQARIKQECEACGVDFLSTPFDCTAVDFLESIGCEAYKIASFELVDIPLIEYTAAKGKPMIISCGMGSIFEIQDAVDACRRMGNEKIVLLKCCSEYPANWADMHLANIPDMKRRFGVPIELSDHSLGSLGAVVGVALGACVVEKHVRLSGIESADSAFSMSVQDFARMVQDVRNAALLASGPDYTLTAAEKKSLIFRRSLFAVQDIKKSEILTPHNIRSIRPGVGLPARMQKALLGKPSQKDFLRGEPLIFKEQRAFSSQRLQYRGILEEDAEVMVSWRSDPDVICYYYDPAPVALETHLQWYRDVYLTDPNRYDFIAYDKNIPVGFVALTHIDRDTGSAEVNYTIGNVSYRNQHLSEEMLEAVVQYGYRHLGLRVFIAGIHCKNVASQRAALASGFELADDSAVFWQFRRCL